MNCLSHMLNKAAVEGKIGYHHLCAGSAVTHLCFADDLLIFTDGRIDSVKNILIILQQFKDLSGLGLNINKTSLVASGVSLSDLGHMLETTGISQTTLPFKYLGLPLCTKKLSITDCGPLIQQVKGKINNWSTKSLSYAGRLQLLKSVISGVTNFWSTAFVLPKRCVSLLNSLCSSFLWKGNATNTKGARVAWSSITAPREEGGLDLKDMVIWNKACVLKLIWLLFFRRQSLWVAWFTKTTLQGNPHKFWSIKPQQRNSWLTNKLIKWRSLIYPYLKTTVGNGCHTSFWASNWSPFGRLSDYIASESPTSTGILANATLSQLWNGHNWCLPHARSDQLVEIHAYLSTISLSACEDSYTWTVNDKTCSNYSTSDIYNLMRTPLPSVDWHQLIWVSGSIPRHCFLAWLMLLDRCPTKDRLINWGLTTNPNCLLCDQQAESRNHLYFDCDYSCTIWTAVSRKLQIPLILNWSQIMDSFIHSRQPKIHTTLILWAWQACIYFLWMERNNRLHRTSAKPIRSLLLQVDMVIRNRSSSLRDSRPAFASAILQRWLDGGQLLPNG